MKLEIRLFRFDAQHDYLPFYQPFLFKAQEGQTLADLLSLHAQNDPLFAFEPSKCEQVAVNKMGVDINTPLETIAAKAGRDLVIEPVAPDRAVLNLQIDTADFDEKFARFAELTDAGDRAYYRGFLAATYLSPLRKLTAAYAGEAFFMLAARLLERHPDQGERILKLVGQEENGLFLYPGMAGRLLEGGEAIDQAVLGLQKRVEAANLAPRGARAGLAFNPQNALTLEALAGQKLALSLETGPFGPALEPLAYEAAFKNNGCAVARFENPMRISGAHLAALAPDTARKAAAGLLLEAMDQGAQTLLCACDEVAAFLKTQSKAIAREAGQPIDMPIVSLGDLAR